MKTPYQLWGIQCGKGWESLVQPLLAMAAEQGAEVLQVKEKFGGLRIYVDGGNEKLQAAIEEAEKKSYRTCEECGQSGTTREGGWLRTLCDTHAEGRKEQRWPPSTPLQVT